MLQATDSVWLRYGTAFVLDILALVLTLLIWPLIEPTITPLFFVAVMSSAWYGGMGPGLLATGLAAFASAFFFIPPLYSLSIGWDDLLRLGVFTLVALLANSLTVARKRAEENLHKAHDELEKRVQERTAELHRLSTELRQAQENERRRIARDLHDGVAQMLSGLFIYIGLLEDLMKSTPKAREYLDQISVLVEQTLDEVRGMAWTLRPAALDHLGLPDAMRGLVTHLSRSAHIGITLQIDEKLPTIPPPVATAMYRISQEALSNILQHANASAVVVHLGTMNGSLRLKITDNGQGISADSSSSSLPHGRGLGLWNMRERAEEAGGTFALHSTLGQGTTVEVTI